MKEKWERLEVCVIPYRNEVAKTKNACVLADIDQLQNSFEELQASLGQLLRAREQRVIREEVEQLQAKIFFA